MKHKLTLLTLLLIFCFQVRAYATPEQDYPNFYATVSWSIPVGMEAYTLPTRFAPSTDGTTGYLPFCKQADCSGGFKSIHEYIRDYTQETIAGATTPEEAAKKIFYEVRDNIEYEDIDFFGAFIAYKYKVGNSGMKASLANAMYRSAKIPARLVIQPATVSPDYLGYNAANSTSTSDDSTLNASEFGANHIYGQVYVNATWVDSDPAWDSGLADAFGICNFGESLKSVTPSGGSTTDVDYTDAFLNLQAHPYLFNTLVVSSTYDEDLEINNYLYFESRGSNLNNYLKNVRYRTTSRSIDGVCKYGIAELQEALDLLSAPADITAATQANDSLAQARVDIGLNQLPQARSHMEDAQSSIETISVFWDEMDLMTLRYNLATFTRQVATALIKPAEANPPTYDLIEPFDNIILNWQVIYGYEAWDDVGMRDYIFENFYINAFANAGYPMNISYITDDNYTILFDPTNLIPGPLDTPQLLLDHMGNRYDPLTTTYQYDGMSEIFPGSPYSPYLSSEPVYSINTPNGFPDFFEAVSNPRLTRYKMQGGVEWQRIRQWYDDVRVANRLLDTYPDASVFFFWGMDNQVFEDTIHRIADSGATSIVLNVSNGLYADFTWMGYEWELANYIASSSNPGLTLVKSPCQQNYDTYTQGLVDALEAEMTNYPDGARIIVGLLSHGFPYHPHDFTYWEYPGCTGPGMPYACPDMYPTGYVYGEDAWHGQNLDQFDRIIDEITNNRPALFAKLDSNSNGVIKWDELWLTSNMFAAEEMDPYDEWAMGSEFFNERFDKDFCGANPSNTCVDPILKEKVDTEGDAIDYFVDIPYFWDIESSETSMHRKMLFGTGQMIWFDDNMRSETVFDPSGHPDWGSGYAPINVVVTRMLLENTQTLQDAYVEAFTDAMQCVAGNDDDCDGVLNSVDNCPQTPNGPSVGTCTSSPAGEDYLLWQPCRADNQCGTAGGVWGICSMNQEDSSANGKGDPCDCCYADVNNDTKVDLGDLVVMKGQFLQPCPPSPCDADCNNDGKVDLADLVIMKGEFLRSGCPTPCQ